MIFRYRPQPERLSATALSTFSDCEQQWAYRSIISDVPIFPKPIPLIYGTVVHLAHERMWRQALLGKSPLKPGLVQYWMMYLNNVFAGRHGAEGESSPPQPIRWLLPDYAASLTPEERAQKIADLKQQYIGKGYYAFRALYLEAAQPLAFHKVEIEYDFASHNIAITGPSGLPYVLSGRIDRLPFHTPEQYEIIDLKTGSVRNTYKRAKVVHDIQMTIYQYVCEQIFGFPPQAMYIQPAMAFASQLKKLETARRGHLALQEQRFAVELRGPNHFEDLARLVDDVRAVIDFVVRPTHYSSEERTQWQPTSHWGKLANLKQNVTESRFIPRVGPWCESCDFAEQCQQNNATGWQAYQLSQQPSSTEPLVQIAAPPSPPNPFTPRTLFDLGRPKTPYLRKSDRQIKKELLASGQFESLKRIPAKIKKLHKLIPVVGNAPCPCVRLNLVSYSMLSLIEQAMANRLAVKDLVTKCPYADCPFKPTTTPPS